MSVWCLYACMLGFRHEVVPVVFLLHKMGMAHRHGDDQGLLDNRVQLEILSGSIRTEAYSLASSSRSSLPLGSSVHMFGSV